MNVRDAVTADLPVLHEMWRDFQREIPDPDYIEVDEEHELGEVDEVVGRGVALIAERDGEPVGYALAELQHPRAGFLHDLYIRPDARGAGLAAELVREVVARLRERGADVLRLEVLASNADARSIYERWGFAPEELVLVAPLDALESRLAGGPEGPTFGSVHVQTDDRAAVERAVSRYVPRLGRSAGTEVSEPRNGWVAVYDELANREPSLLQRLARELSYAIGSVTLAIGVERGSVVRYSLFDRGGAVDEYLSVPEFYGPLAPGDVVALGSNPRVVARLTGADPARVRAVARTASSPGELPPAEELLREIAATMGVEGADRGWLES
jgi:ribosomal protein S18 acetylase RimI-like enzyme